jgi:hypothetical protein
MNMRMNIKLLASTLLLSWTACMNAELAVSVSVPKVIAKRAVVALAMKNGFNETIESARAVVFLSDDQGKVVARETRWVIGGGKDLPVLATGATNIFNFVVSANNRLTTTNLTANVRFTRLVLEGGRLADISREVSVRAASR